MALALFAELKALPSVAFNAMALPSTLLDWWVPSAIPLASTASLVEDFFCFSEPAGWWRTVSIVLTGLALFTSLQAVSSVALNVMALPSTLLDWWVPGDPFAAIFWSLVLSELESAGELSTMPVDLGGAPFSSAAFWSFRFSNWQTWQLLHCRASGLIQD
jgi:hypothetical protein